LENEGENNAVEHEDFAALSDHVSASEVWGHGYE
jgi:hypothetical protein